MKITASALQLASSHSETTRHEVRERLRMWSGPALAPRPAVGVSDPVRLSDAGRNRQSADAVEAAADAIGNDPMLSLLRAIIEAMTGRPMELFDAARLGGQPAATVEAPDAAQADTSAATANFGVEYERHDSYSESETTRFAAEGVVRTADGKEIRFSLDLEMQRDFRSETDVSLRAGNAVKKDPLVINFSGTAAQLSDRKFSIDLDADGTAESAHFLASGSGFLVFDRNTNGRIDDGREMFGAISGDGFADLAALDGDHNGWIDEADAAYQQLKVWTKDADGKDRYATLAESGVGALSLARVASPFALKDQTNVERGAIRSSGIYLREDGGVGTVQQIDLSV